MTGSMTGPDKLFSPVSGRALRPDGPHALSDGDAERWPVVDGIAYLRTPALARSALARLDAGDRHGALATLLAENDSWWPEPPPPEAALRALAEDADGAAPPSLREAMARLGWGRVGDYFAHRWSDPTFVAGLALCDAHWVAPRAAFELCCGIGHHLRALQQAGVAVAGADVVFGKLWVARRWVLGPEARLICFDAETGIWPLDRRFDLVACHDAFYFLRDKPHAARRLRMLAGLGPDRDADRGPGDPAGLLAISHVHNRDWPNLSGGAACGAGELAALFPGAIAYDDAELTRAGAAGRAPRPQPWEALAGAEAFSLAVGAPAAPRPAAGPLSLPPDGTILVRNPLLDGAGRVRWPSDRYREEYAPRATYGRAAPCPPPRAAMAPPLAGPAARRDLLALPDNW